MSGYFRFETLNKMHIELSSLCNSICPNCPRYFQNSPNEIPELIPQSISIENFKKWFPPETLKQITYMNFCGNHGDPVTCKDLLPILEYCFTSLPKNGGLQMHTNGGMKSAKVWNRIGELFAQRPGWKMIFSVDGLEDTNHIYRRNVNWKKLIENIKEYTQHGGDSDWEYLIFRHNEHQIDEAKRMSKELGVKQFVQKIAHGLDNGVNYATMPAIDKSGKTDYQIYPPREKKNKVNYIKGSDDKIIIKDKSFEKVTYINEDNELAFIAGTSGLDRMSAQELEELDNTVIRLSLIHI